MLEFIAPYRDLIIAIHVWAMILGVGGATYSDVLLFRFLKDMKISQKEKEVIHTMSMVILVSLLLALVSGVLLFALKAEILLQTPKFLLKMIAFLILCINGVLLHFFVLPHLLKFTFHKNHLVGFKKINLRHMSFAMGAVSVVSWYTVFLMGVFPVVPISFEWLLGLYVAGLLGAITVALCIEHFVMRHVQGK